MEAFLIEVAKVATAATAVCTVLGCLGSKALEHWLGRLAKDHENEIKTASEQTLIELRRQLDTDAAKLIEAFRIRITEDSALRTETFKSQLAADSARSLEILKSQLARDLQISMELAKIRQPTYQSLWSMMETVSISRAEPLTSEDRQKFDDELTSYYYKMAMRCSFR